MDTLLTTHELPEYIEITDDDTYHAVVKCTALLEVEDPDLYDRTVAL